MTVLEEHLFTMFGIVDPGFDEMRSYDLASSDAPTPDHALVRGDFMPKLVDEVWRTPQFTQGELAEMAKQERADRQRSAWCRKSTNA